MVFWLRILFITYLIFYLSIRLIWILILFVALEKKLLYRFSRDYFRLNYLRNSTLPHTLYSFDDLSNIVPFQIII